MAIPASLALSSRQARRSPLRRRRETARGPGSPALPAFRDSRQKNPARRPLCASLPRGPPLGSKRRVGRVPATGPGPKRLWNVVTPSASRPSERGFCQQSRGLAALAVVRIAEVQRTLRHPMEAQQEDLGREGERVTSFAAKRHGRGGRRHQAHRAHDIRCLVSNTVAVVAAEYCGKAAPAGCALATALGELAQFGLDAGLRSRRRL